MKTEPTPLPTMPLALAIEIARDFNDWRRSQGIYYCSEDDPFNSPVFQRGPTEIGTALDTLIAHAEKSTEGVTL